MTPHINTLPFIGISIKQAKLRYSSLDSATRKELLESFTRDQDEKLKKWNLDRGMKFRLMNSF